MISQNAIIQRDEPDATPPRISFENPEHSSALSAVSMTPLPEPLPRDENRNLEKNVPTADISLRKFVQTIDPKTPEGQKRLIEARSSATPKQVYVNAIKRHCLECYGVNPAVSDCGGDELIDGTRCRLYDLNTPFKRRKATKTALKRGIKAECRFCMNGNPLTDCSSPDCDLYPYGAGALTPRAAEINKAG